MFDWVQFLHQKVHNYGVCTGTGKCWRCGSEDDSGDNNDDG